MKILIADHETHAGELVFLKGQKYVTSDMIATNLLQGGGLRLWASGEAFTRRWYGQDLAGKTLIIHRALGIGDEFLAARLAEVAKRVYRAGRVVFACFESHHSFWRGNELPFELAQAVVPWDMWRAADYHVAGEGLWESFGGADQPDAWDAMGLACGITIADADRYPLIPVPSAEVVAETAAKLAGWLGDRPLVLWGVSASSRIRSYPPEQTRKAIAEIVERTGAAVVAIGAGNQVADYELEDGPDIAVYSAGVPGMIALAHVAANRPQSCIVTPDSLLGHVAAALPGLPCVSLWSSFDPSKRIATYKNHIPIWRKIRCSPCFAHERSGNAKDAHGCPLTACNDYCAGLRTIDPMMIAEQVERAMKKAEPCNA